MDTNTAPRGNTYRYVVLTLRKDGKALDFCGGADLICAAGVMNLVHNYKSSKNDATFALVASEDPSRLYNRLTRNGISIVDSRIVDTELDSVQVYNALDSALKAGLPRNDIRHLEAVLHSEVPSYSPNRPEVPSYSPNSLNRSEVNKSNSGISIFDSKEGVGFSILDPRGRIEFPIFDLTGVSQ